MVGRCGGLMFSRITSGTIGPGLSPVGKTLDSHIASLHTASHRGLGGGELLLATSCYRNQDTL